MGQSLVRQEESMEEQPQKHKPFHECTNKSQNYGQSLSDWATNPDTNHSSCTSSYAPCIFDLGSSLTHYPGGRPSFSHIHPASQPSFINIHQRQSMSGDLLSWLLHIYFIPRDSCLSGRWWCSGRDGSRCCCCCSIFWLTWRIRKRTKRESTDEWNPIHSVAINEVFCTPSFLSLLLLPTRRRINYVPKSGKHIKISIMASGRRKLNKITAAKEKQTGVCPFVFIRMPSTGEDATTTRTNCMGG